MSPRGTDSQFVRLLRPVTVWLTVQRWDGRKVPESPHLRVTNAFFFRSGRYDCSESNVFLPDPGAKNSVWERGGGGEPSLFSGKNISQKCGPLRTLTASGIVGNAGPWSGGKGLSPVFTQWTAVNTDLSHRGASLGGSRGDGGGRRKGTWLQQQTSQLQPCSKQIYRNTAAFYWQTIAAIIWKRRRGHFTEQLSTF